MNGQSAPETRHEFFANRPGFPAKTVVFTVFIGAFFGYLNETLLNVALTTLMHEFSVGKTTVQWVSTGFLLVMGAFTPITANVIQWFTTRTMLMITLAVFLAGSLTAAFAPNFGLLLAGRMIQAVSAAFTVPVLLNTILLIYPPERRGVAMGLVTTMFVAAPAIGPTLSGVIVDYFGWRYLFLLTVPFIVLAMVLAWLFLKTNLQPLNRPRIDVPSAVLSVAGFGGLVYAFSNFSALGAPAALALAAVAVLLLWGFVKRQGRLAVPLVDLKVLRYGQYRTAAAVLAAAVFCFIGMELVMPMYLQQVVMLSATATGLVLLPGSVLEALVAPAAGAVLDRRGIRTVVLPGAGLLLGVFVLMLLLFRPDSAAWLLAAVFTMLPVAAVLLMTAETHGLNALPKPMYPHGTAVITTVNPIAGALGAAFFVGVMQAGEQYALAGKTAPSAAEAQAAMMAGVNWSFAAGAAVAGGVLWLAVKFRNRRTQTAH